VKIPKTGGSLILKYKNINNYLTKTNTWPNNTGIHAIYNHITEYFPSKKGLATTP
jgi:hypothetical protein